MAKIIIEDKMGGSINVKNIGNSVEFTILVPNSDKGIAQNSLHLS